LKNFNKRDRTLIALIVMIFADFYNARGARGARDASEASILIASFASFAFIFFRTKSAISQQLITYTATTLVELKMTGFAYFKSCIKPACSK